MPSTKPSIAVVVLLVLEFGCGSTQQAGAQEPPTGPPEPATEQAADDPQGDAQRPPEPKADRQQQGAPQQAAADETARPQQKIDALNIAQLEAELQEVEARLESARQEVSPERAEQLGIDQEALAERVARLEELKNVIRRRITALNSLEKVQKTIAGLKEQIQDFAQVGMEAEPPYELTLLDTLRDELDTVRRKVETDDALSVETLQASVDLARQRLEEAEADRRRKRDQLEEAEDKASAPLQWQLKLAQWAQRVAGHELAQAEAQLELARRESRSDELRIDLLEDKIEYVDDKVEFSPRELNKHLDELDARRKELESHWVELRRTDQDSQTKLEQAREALERARGEEEIRRRTEAFATSEALAQATSRGVEILQERINNIAKMKSLWERRFALTRDPSEPELTEWKRSTQETLEEIIRKREEIEQRLQTLRTMRLDLEKQLSSWDPAMGDKSQVETRLRALKDREERETAYLASLVDLERLAQRVARDIEKERQTDSWQKYWSRFLHTAGGYWRRELFVVYDQAFRVGELIWAAIVFCLLLVAAGVARMVLRRTLRRRPWAAADAPEEVVDNALLSVLQRTNRLFVILIAAYLALLTLPLFEAWTKILHYVAIIIATTQAAIWANAALGGMIEKAKKRRIEEDPSAASAFGLMGFFARVAIWSAALLLILTNLGYEIGPLLAGLGVGGVAVAFALQSILGDIFCSVAIVLDKPFVVGDFIIVDNLLGTVENIGIKTTRLRSLSGEQIVFSNADLIGSRVRNYKRMFERRIIFTFGVVYETSPEKLQQIPVIVRTIIEGIDQVRFDRAHFKEYGDFSLNFEVVYYVLVPDYNVYMDIHQEVNLRLFGEFREKGIAFAYPTREIIVRPDGQAKVSTQPRAFPAGESEPHRS